jgi:hypothetical protein
MKVAINRCFGGFGLSERAFELLLAKKGIPFEKRDSGSKLMGNEYYVAGHLGQEDRSLYEHNYCKDRSDPDLIAVIEELRKEADGWAADLAVVDIPDDVKWHIHEYDGIEHVAEDHRTWYGDN